MKEKFNKISVLLIEDNPTQIGGFEGSVFKDEKGNNIFAKYLNSVIIPSINLNTYHTDLSHQFSLKVLQHPVEVKEFVQLTRDAENEIGINGIGSIPGLLPEIIVFDYLLWQNVQTNRTQDNKGSRTFNILYNDNSKPIRQFLNPNFILLDNLKYPTIKRLQLEEEGEYSEEEFILSLNKVHDLDSINADTINNDRNELHSDDMGLFCGISTWQLFRNHISVPIPATHNKDQVQKLKAHSKFYEWLFEYEIGHVTQEKFRSEKTWAEIIPKSVERLRKRIFSMASQFRISFDLENILNLATGAHIEELKKPENSQDPLKAGFIFTTPYGKRCFHLAALFLETKDENERNDKIKEYANSILQQFGIDDNSYMRVKDSYERIWETFCKTYAMVFEFSNLQLQSYYIIPEKETEEEKKNREEVQKIRDKRIAELKPILGITGEGLNADFSNPVSVFEEKHLSKPEKTKVMLLLITRLYWNYLKARKDSNFGDITNEEIAIVLSPLRSEYNRKGKAATCILPFHKPMISDQIIKDKELKDDFYRTQNNISSLIPGYGSTGNLQLFNLDWVSPQDKKFVCSFFSEEVHKFVYGDFAIELPPRLKKVIS